MRDWLRIALRRDVAIRNLRVGVLVGTMLVVINQGDVLLTGQISSETLWKILMTYCVPYGVSTYASVSAILDKGRSKLL